MKRHPLIPALFVCALLGACQKLPPDQERFLKAQKAYDNGEYAQALEQLRPIAQSGSPAGLLLLAKMFAYGKGVPFNPEKAEVFHGLAAVQLAQRGMVSMGSQQEVSALQMARHALNDKQLNIPEAGLGVDEGTDLNATTVLNPETLQKVSVDLQKQVDDALGPEPNPTSTPTSTPDSAAIPEPTILKEALAVPASPIPSQMEIRRDSHRAESLTVGVLREGAEKGDLLAMRLLATGYAQGFYGLKKDSQQAARWSGRLLAAQRAHPHAESLDETQNPMASKRFKALIAIGLGLMGVGVWRVFKR